MLFISSESLPKDIYLCSYLVKIVKSARCQNLLHVRLQDLDSNRLLLQCDVRVVDRVGVEGRVGRAAELDQVVLAELKLIGQSGIFD